MKNKKLKDILNSSKRRKKVFQLIESERNFQEENKPDKNSHIVDDFPLGSGLSAIEEKLRIARSMWYNSVQPHQEAMNEIRKIAAICVQMGEKYGMPERE